MSTQTKTVEVTGDNSPKQSITFNASVRDWVLGSILAISIVTNIALIFAYRDDGTEQRLRQYETSQLRTQADLNTKLQEMILIMQGCKK